MKKQEWDTATEAERYEEIQRCMKPHYFYNTYFKKPHMPPISEQEWDERINWYNVPANRFRRRT